MATIVYPLVNGFRHAFASIESEIALPNGVSLIFRGYKAINYSRKRDREKVRGNHPDPIAKTRGENDYSCDVEVYLAEWNEFQAQAKKAADAAGVPYGDLVFNTKVRYGENGFDLIQDEIQGCTIDSTEASNAQGTAALTRKIDFNPLKILFNGIDDTTPMQGTTA